MLLTFLSAVICANLIPRERIAANVRKTSSIISDEGTYFNPLDNTYYMRDNFTDALMVNIAMTADDNHPISSAMDACYTGIGSMDMPLCLTMVANGDTCGLPVTKYARYWHGNQVFLRPLLTIMDLSGIRILNYICFAILFVLLAYLLYTKTDIGTCMIFMLTVYGFIIPIVPSSMQFSACFYVGLLSCLAILIWPGLVRDETSLATTLFCIGGITSFIDLLTTPLLTLGLSLAIANILYKNKANRRTIVGFLSWGFGYALLWISKWIIGYLLTGFNIFSDAIGAAKFRVSNAVILDTPSTITVEEYRIISICIVAILWIGIIVLSKVWQKNRENNWLLAIAMLYPTWKVILFNHSQKHCFFTWRSYTITAVAILLYAYLTIKNLKYENRNTDTLL